MATPTRRVLKTNFLFYGFLIKGLGAEIFAPKVDENQADACRMDVDHF
jgi:hypothetical protein